MMHKIHQQVEKKVAEAAKQSEQMAASLIYLKFSLLFQASMAIKVEGIDDRQTSRPNTLNNIDTGKYLFN